MQAKLITWNISSTEIRKFQNRCYIHSPLISFSVLLKHKSLSFINLSFDLTLLQYFGWNLAHQARNLYILSRHAFHERDQPSRCTCFGAKLAFIVRILLKRYPWYFGIQNTQVWPIFPLGFFHTIWNDWKSSKKHFQSKGNCF